MRDTRRLHPALQQKAADFLTACEKVGLHVRITECERTVAEQDALYAQGRTAPGSIVTSCSGSSYSSLHQWGIAFDICRNDGKGAYYNDDGFFQKCGEIGMMVGLEWGGSWTGFVDMPHYQLPEWGSTSSVLKAKYGTPENFRKTWTGESCFKNLADLTDAELEQDLKIRTGIKALQSAVGMPKTGFPTAELLKKLPQIKENAADTMPEFVKPIQYILSALGEDVKVNGKYGQATRYAIVRFKKSHGIDSNSAMIKAAGPCWKALLKS